jgi:broad specificity phosphatase PhoE
MIGWTDLPADLGDSARITRLSGHLPEAPVISSDLRRASATADALAAGAPGRPRLPHDPDLRELNFGGWEGLRHADADAATQKLLRRFYETPGDHCPPGGESWNQLAARSDRAADRLLATGAPEVIVVAHMGVILTQLQRALGIGAYETLSHRIEPLSVTVLRHDGRWHAEAINLCP